LANSPILYFLDWKLCRQVQNLISFHLLILNIWIN